MLKLIDSFKNEYEGIESQVVRTNSGYVVSFWNSDRGEGLPTSRTFTEKTDAMDFAKQIVGYQLNPNKTKIGERIKWIGSENLHGRIIEIKDSGAVIKSVKVLWDDGTQSNFMAESMLMMEDEN